MRLVNKTDIIFLDTGLFLKKERENCRHAFSGVVDGKEQKNLDKVGFEACELHLNIFNPKICN